MTLLFAVLSGILIGIAGGVFLGRRYFSDKAPLEALQTQLADIRVREAALEAEKQKLQTMQEQQQAYFNNMQAAAKAQFGEVAAALLKEKSQELNLKNLEILNPLAENIKQFKAEIKSLEKETIDKNARLETQLTQMQALNQNLAKEASGLTQALQNKKMQGNLGEMILEDVLQSGGLQEGIHYTKQEFFRGEGDSRNFPDFIINLPDSRRIVIDSKMSVSDYARWVAEADEAKKAGHMKAHLEAIRANIKKLSGKEYQKMLKENSLDFALMFIPIEYAYMAALEHDKELSAFAGDAKVAIVTASSLFPVIRIIEGLWRLERTNKSMKEIVRNGEEMHKKVVAFLADMDRLGAQMRTGQKTYMEAMSKLSGQGGILSRARALENLGIKTTKSLGEGEEILQQPLLEVAAQEEEEPTLL